MAHPVWFEFRGNPVPPSQASGGLGVGYGVSCRDSP